MRPQPLVLCLLGMACTLKPSVDSDEPVAAETPKILIYVTPDTLGFVAARETGWCERLGSILAEYGRDLACAEGGVSPSSWTGEAHTRMLWPNHQVDALRLLELPECGSVSVLERVKHPLDATYVWGADNSLLGGFGSMCPEDGLRPWFHGTDEAYSMSGFSFDIFLQPEEERAVYQGITSILEAANRGENVVGFLNAFEVGGHEPRCYFDPTAEACDALWNVAADAGLVDPDQNREETWLDQEFLQALNMYVAEASNRKDEFRPIYWGTMKEAIAYHRLPRFDDRLARLLDGLEDAGRLDELLLVIVADHGENPCVSRADGTLECSHSGQTTEWTGIVPVFVSPAWVLDEWRAESLIGDATHPWSTVNLAYGLLSLYGVDRPDDWPEAEAPGSVTSWTCRNEGQATRKAGIRIVGDESLRCSEGSCQAFSWEVPEDLTYDPTPLSEIPDAVLEFGGTPNWFDEACTDESK